MGGAMRRVLRCLGPAATLAFDQLASSPKSGRRLATAARHVVLLCVPALVAMTLPALPTAEAVTLPKSFSLTLVGEPRLLHRRRRTVADGRNERAAGHPGLRTLGQQHRHVLRHSRHPCPLGLMERPGRRRPGPRHPGRHPLVAGHYPRAVRPTAREAGEAGLDISNGHGCTNRGSFGLRDIHFTDGVVDRMWMLFEMSCGTRPGSCFGTFRIGMGHPASRGHFRGRNRYVFCTGASLCPPGEKTRCEWPASDVWLIGNRSREKR